MGRVKMVVDGRYRHRWRAISIPGGMPRIVAAIAIVLLLQGCGPKVQVTYIPREKQPVAGEIQGDDRETVLQLKRHYQRWRGTPYADGGMSPAGIDCSGFTVLAYRELFDLPLPRTAGEQAGSGREVSKTALQPGDLVFFHTGLWQKHVGIYLADDQFIHASLSRGVTISSLDDTYWREKYWQARRMSAPERLSKAESVAVLYR
jgi:hypothetical protein